MTDYAEDILASLKERMRNTPQPPQWHGEGDVYRHTMMVCEALCALPEYQALPERRRDVLLAAAKLHDIGKIPTTKEIGEHLESSHHAPVGSRMVRERLWKAGMCGSAELMVLREAICLLIRYHSLPPSCHRCRRCCGETSPHSIELPSDPRLFGQDALHTGKGRHARPCLQ